ncbi:hypothetical protein ACLB2K_066465 [Fragaria x ananassa]
MGCLRVSWSSLGLNPKVQIWRRRPLEGVDRVVRLVAVFGKLGYDYVVATRGDSISSIVFGFRRGGATKLGLTVTVTRSNGGASCLASATEVGIDAGWFRDWLSGASGLDYCGSLDGFKG